MSLAGRRRFLKVLLAAIAGTLTYGAYRGVRFPSLSLEASPLPSSTRIGETQISMKDAISTRAERTNQRTHTQLAFRAFGPEPELQLLSNTGGRYEIKFNNLHKNARLTVDTEIPYEELKIAPSCARLLKINLPAGTRVTFSWTLEFDSNYRFAAIGDTGGDLELQWCIKRAESLGAQFLLHLGDFNYQAGDYDRAINLFNNSPIPCYVSIGNHDFHEKGLIYHQFLQEIGPLNHAFSIGKTRFVNIDTAANFFPYGSGLRGKLFDQLQNNKDDFQQSIAFTHRPLHDPSKEGEEKPFDQKQDHDIGSAGERDWLIEQLKLANIDTLLSGHLHIFNRSRYQGIDNIIVGQGLGHQDLLTNSDYSKIAIGKVDSLGAVDFEFPNLAMPMNLHCHPRSDEVKRSLQNTSHSQSIEKVVKACSQRT